MFFKTSWFFFHRLLRNQFCLLLLHSVPTSRCPCHSDISDRVFNKDDQECSVKHFQLLLICPVQGHSQGLLVDIYRFRFPGVFCGLLILFNCDFLTETLLVTRCYAVRNMVPCQLLPKPHKKMTDVCHLYVKGNPRTHISFT